MFAAPYPISLRTTATPIAAPTPTLPAATAAEAATTRASILPSACALTSTPAARSGVPEIRAEANLPPAPGTMRFIDTAPAPETATPTFPKPAAIDAATATTLIRERSIARTEIWLISPPSCDKWPRPEATPTISAIVDDCISLSATEAPIETPTPTLPKAAATETDKAVAVIRDLLPASTEISVAKITGPSIPSGSPAITAWVSIEISLRTPTPEPETATPVLPAATATEPVKAIARIECCDKA